MLKLKKQWDPLGSSIVVLIASHPHTIIDQGSLRITTENRHQTLLLKKSVEIKVMIQHFDRAHDPFILLLHTMQ